MDIRKIAIADLELAPNLGELLAEYAAESSIDALRANFIGIQFETYEALEAAGVLHPLAAYDDDGRLIGFLLLLVSALPHYGCKAATTESFFVAAAHRKSGAGLGLLHAAEEVARSAGAVGLLVSAPAGGRLSQVLHGAVYRLSNEVFFRSLA